ncbi:MAG: nucleotidyl transferase AbiEii/AbiGii toxin family protein, partial [Bacteroidetes bacterium]|nr:nucleotidyl transferase AbiEii/AbiGii toxin family protein [Bacteroidota bacterium]
MLDWESLLALYPKPQRVYTRHILREYLQYQILKIIYQSPFAAALNFLGGTALRIVHNSPRFSEDLDFDNLNLTPDDFQTLANHIKLELERSGYQVETREVYKGAYRCYIRFPNLLFERGISGYTEEKVLIQLDTAPQRYEY